MFGLVFGSFANVVIWRFPRGENLSHPDSHCPVCETPILWRDNIPVVSWLLLRGRCRSCGVPISPRYPIVELMSGALWVLAGLRFGMSAQTGFAVAFFYILLLLSWIDLDTMHLPNKLVGLLAVIGLAGAVFAQFSGIAAVPLIGQSLGWMTGPLPMAIGGALISAGPALLLSVVMGAILRRPALGMGDVKLLGVIGLFLGGYGVMSFFVGSMVGVVYSLAFRDRSIRVDDDERDTPYDQVDSAVDEAAYVGGAVDAPDSDSAQSEEAPSDMSRHKGTFPFGPALAAGAVIVTLFGPQLWMWYQSLFV